MYVFLGDDCKQPVIISSLLNPLEEEELLKDLKKDNGVMRWDLNGVIPAFCVHKTKKEENCNPVVQPQELPTPTLENLVKKEVMKLFETDMLSTIFDSFRVNPIHLGPKREDNVEDPKEAPKSPRKKKRKNGSTSG
ncbi:hypothetical protein A2U01_0023415 [Trifolium medium]|uniref:Uncharacterized protein n=1 Tax=Trifolium medium TaxID=97028 RepID=A0A392NRD7_9FABA|nr:hypothetical protein [Trifolium medium]